MVNLKLIRHGNNRVGYELYIKNFKSEHIEELQKVKNVLDDIIDNKIKEFKKDGQIKKIKKNYAKKKENS